MVKYKYVTKKPKQLKHWFEKIHFKGIYFKNRPFRITKWYNNEYYAIECGYSKKNFDRWAVSVGCRTFCFPNNFKDFKMLLNLMVEKSRVAESLDTTCFIDEDLNEEYF